MTELPITADAAQSFVTQLGLAKLKFDIQWNDRSNQFSLSLSNDETLQVYVYGQPLVLGQELLEAYNYGIGALLLVDTSKQGSEATLDDFGTRTKLYWFSEDEVQSVIDSAV
jgi:hypothetical protein